MPLVDPRSFRGSGRTRTVTDRCKRTSCYFDTTDPCAMPRFVGLVGFKPTPNGVKDRRAIATLQALSFFACGPFGLRFSLHGRLSSLRWWGCSESDRVAARGECFTGTVRHQPDIPETKKPPRWVSPGGSHDPWLDLELAALGFPLLLILAIATEEGKRMRREIRQAHDNARPQRFARGGGHGSC